MQLLSLMALLVLALVSISHCNNKYEHYHPQPCCEPSHCIRLIYDNYSGTLRWHRGCCQKADPYSDQICYPHHDGYGYIVKGLCDYQSTYCYSNQNQWKEENGSSLDSDFEKTPKVNQTDVVINPSIIISDSS